MQTCCQTSSVCLDCRFGSRAAATFLALYESSARSCGVPAADDAAVDEPAADETFDGRSRNVEVRPRTGPFAGYGPPLLP